jgi:16S rRNA processing protein RimM
VPQDRVLMGVIGRPHGVRGLVHVRSYTEDPSDLPDYGPFSDERGRRFNLRWASEGVAVLTELVDGQKVPVPDRTAAEKLVNVKLYVERDQLPATDEEEFYLVDLVGLQAVKPDGSALGTVQAVHDYGAGTSLEIGGDDHPALLVPFTRACVPDVNVPARRLVVVPPAEVVVAPDAAEPDAAEPDAVAS